MKTKARLTAGLFLFNETKKPDGSSTARHAGRVSDVGARIADEHAPVRHLHRAKRPGVERRVGRKQYFKRVAFSVEPDHTLKSLA
jgi:hypothetical protein